MPDEYVTNFGVIRFMPYEAFHNPNLGLNREARVERMVEAYGESGPRPQDGWSRVSLAIRDEGMFKIVTSTPELNAELHFNPDKPDTGFYEIRHLPERRGRVERGRTLNLQAVPPDENNANMAMLTQFKVRYYVVTLADDRARTKLVWLVGLNNFRNLEETAAT